MNQGELVQLLTAVCVVPTALTIGLIVTYLVANLEQIKYKWRERKGGKVWRNL